MIDLGSRCGPCCYSAWSPCAPIHLLQWGSEWRKRRGEPDLWHLLLFIWSLAGGNTPCKMCLVAQGTNSLLVCRWGGDAVQRLWRESRVSGWARARRRPKAGAKRQNNPTTQRSIELPVVAGRPCIPGHAAERAHVHRSGFRLRGTGCESPGPWKVGPSKGGLRQLPARSRSRARIVRRHVRWPRHKP